MTSSWFDWQQSGTSQKRYSEFKNVNPPSVFPNEYYSKREEHTRTWQATNIWYLDGPGRHIKRPPEAIKYEWDKLNTQIQNAESILQGETETEAEVIVEEPCNENKKAPHESDENEEAPCEWEENEEAPCQPKANEEAPDVGNAFPPACEISVLNEDTFTVAAMCWDQGFNPMVLNMANASQPGGGVYKGCMAQEEDLFRRSDYFLAVPAKHYPLGHLEVLYSPRVTVYLDKDYGLLESVQAFSCLAAAADRDPKTLPNLDDPLNEADRLYEDSEVAERTRKKILMIFQVAIDQGHDCLVLGSLGCGAFKNPQMRIIDYFNEGIQKYRSYFRKIVFAVLSKKDPNFELFDKHILR